MTQDHATVAIARRNVARRIDRFLKGLERARRQPNRREAYHVRDALERLQAEQFAEGEDAMLRAERAARLPDHVANSVASNEVVMVTDLRKQLDHILLES